MTPDISAGDIRLDGFFWVWDVPVDLSQPEWQQAAEQSVHYLAHWLDMEIEDFKIECQDCEQIEEADTNMVGGSLILMNWNKYWEYCNNSDGNYVSPREIGLAVDGFLSGYIYRVNEVQNVSM